MIFTVIVSLIISLIPFTGVHAQSNPSLQSKDTLRMEEFACIAKDPASLKDCINQVRTIKVPLVKIDAPIICSNQSDCAFDFSGINTDTTFFATKPENKIFRSDDYSYTVFNLNNSSGIKFSGLVLQDEGIGSCPSGTICPPVFLINKSGKITIEETLFANSKGTSLLISDSADITVTVSKFQNGLKDGIDVTSIQPSINIKIDKNSFDGISGNAISFQGGIGIQNSINSNTFNNNHAKGYYGNCTYPCIGSQVQIIGPTANLEFRQNKMTGGSNTIFDSLGLYPSGLEIGSKDINNLKIYCNEISGNLGSGIVQSTPVTNSGQISIDENKIWANGLDMNIASATVGANNCYSNECNLPCMTQ